MTKKNKLVPKAFHELSEKTVDKLVQRANKKSKLNSRNLNAKVKRTYLNPRFND